MRKRLVLLWPQAPLAALMAAIGLLNILDGLRLPLTVLQRVRALNGLAESFSAVGGTAQVLLGILLVLVGAGLMWRLAAAWVFSVVLILVTLALDAARQRWGLYFVLQALMLCALLLVKNRFTRRAPMAGIVFSAANIVAILAYGIFGTYLLGDGFQPHIHDLGTAVYFAIATLSTVGYGDIVPASAEARWFVISLLVVGLGVFATAIASALGPKISAELDLILRPHEKRVKPENHIILVGNGSVARNTARELHRRRLDFVHIVNSMSASDQSAAHVIEGDATDDAILRRAGIEHARLVVAALEDDGENAFIALGSKDLNPNVKVLAVASSAQSIKRLKLARADLVFSPLAVGSRLLADLAEGNAIVPEFQDLLEGRL
jgi:voltage-gated potassium channel